MQLFIVQNGQSAGPFEEEQVRAMLAGGQITPDTLCCPVGGAEWRPLSGVLGGGVPPVMSLAPYPAPYAAAAVPTNGLAIASLALGCAAFVCCGATSIPAVVCGHLALGQLKRSGGAQTGRGLAIAGLATGYVMIAGVALYFIFILGIAIIGAASGGK